MVRSRKDGGAASPRLVQVPTRSVAIEGAELASRLIGERRAGDLPLVALTHLGANLDGWDPEVIEPLAEHRLVAMIGYRGVGASTGTVRASLDEMAADAIAAIRALGYDRVDLLGLSMGGMVAQALLEQAPELVDRVVLASSAPRGGAGLTRMTGVMVRGILRGALTFTAPTTLLFFTRTRAGRQAAGEYQARLLRRRVGRDDPVTLGAIRAQLRAVREWARSDGTRSADAARPALIIHGDSDRMVAPENAAALRARFEEAQVRIFPDSGHGVVFQNRRAVTDAIARFLRR